MNESTVAEGVTWKEWFREHWNEISQEQRDMLAERYGFDVNGDYGSANDTDDLVLHEMQFRDGVLDMKLSGKAAKNFMAVLVAFFEQNGGKNFLTISVQNQDRKYGITILNCDGIDTPAERIGRLEQLLQGFVDGYDESSDGSSLYDSFQKAKKYFETKVPAQTV